MAYATVPNNIYGFHHICFDKNGREVFEEQFKALTESGLYNATTTIFASVLGNRNGYQLPSKYKIIHEATSGKAAERPILEFMQRNAATRPGKYYYLHTKGISHVGTPKYQHMRDWRMYMEHFIVYGWRRCVTDLDEYDIAGILYQPSPPHFSGNFWWTKSSYIANNPTNFDYKYYYETEYWLCKGVPAPIGISYHNVTNIHTEGNYGPSRYLGDSKQQMPLIFSPGLSDVDCEYAANSSKNIINAAPIDKRSA